MKKPPANTTRAKGGRGLRVLVLQSRFNESVVGGLAAGAVEYLREVDARFEVEPVPGAFELPLVAQAAASTGRYDAVVALGAVIRGETDHYDHICREAARGLLDASMNTGIPVAFGVLTVQKESHALARSKPGPHNKGREAASAAVETALLLKKLSPPTRKRS